MGGGGGQVGSACRERTTVPTEGWKCVQVRLIEARIVEIVSAAQRKDTKGEGEWVGIGKDSLLLPHHASLT